MGSGVTSGKEVPLAPLGTAVSSFARASFCRFVIKVILLIPVLMLSKSSPALSTVVTLALSFPLGLDDLELVLGAATVGFLARGAFGAGLFALAVLVFFTARGPPAVVLTLMEVAGLSVIDVMGRSLIGAENIDSPDSVIVDAALVRLPCLVCVRPLGCGVMLLDTPCRCVNKTICIRAASILCAYLFGSEHRSTGHSPSTVLSRVIIY